MLALTLARTVHVLALVHWLGGVAMVTLVILPGILRGEAPARQYIAFAAVEARFAPQARVSVALAGLSGLYLLWQLGGPARLLLISQWWLQAMVLLWLVFALLLFVLEPLWLHRILARRAALDPAGTCRRLLTVHRVLLAAGAFTLGAGMLGAHGAWPAG
ncbi:MAG: hypothetical protein SV108_04150 [Pseudomonadota bacterium]|nr:hypothetical protein [Pseudomonadota bacterium]HJO35458.1 hypothetical protein [Gammaproteobacteria bacterium]